MKGKELNKIGLFSNIRYETRIALQIPDTLNFYYILVIILNKLESDNSTNLLFCTQSHL